MDTFRSIGVHADELTQCILNRGAKTRETAARVEECVKHRLEESKSIEERLKTKESLAATSNWTHHYDSKLTRRLEREASLLEAALKQEEEKYEKAQEQLHDMEAAGNQKTLDHAELEKSVIENRRRYELFLGLRFGKVKPGEIRFFFNHVDVKDPSKEFAFSIRSERRTNRIVDCCPEVGERCEKVSEKLSAGRLTIPQVVCEMRAIFKAMTVSQ